MGWEAGLCLLHWAGGHCRLLAAALSPLSPARAWSLGCKFSGSNTTSSAIPCHVRAQQQSKALNFEWFWVYTISRGARLIGWQSAVLLLLQGLIKAAWASGNPGGAAAPALPTAVHGLWVSRSDLSALAMEISAMGIFQHHLKLTPSSWSVNS